MIFIFLVFLFIIAAGALVACGDDDTTPEPDMPVVPETETACGDGIDEEDEDCEWGDYVAYRLATGQPVFSPDPTDWADLPPEVDTDPVWPGVETELAHEGENSFFQDEYGIRVEALDPAVSYWDTNGWPDTTDEQELIRLARCFVSQLDWESDDEIPF